MGEGAGGRERSERETGESLKKGEQQRLLLLLLGGVLRDLVCVRCIVGA